MNIGNLKEGMVVKNYKKLCKLLEIEVKSGNTKISQMKELETFCSFHRNGQKIIIDKIYDNPIPKEDGRTLRKINSYPNFNVNEDEVESIGVYKIELGNYIYIGSTVVSFKRRFKEHTFNNNKLITKEMIKNGAIFTILQNCDGMSEPEVRLVENIWIEEYKNNPNYILVNSNKAYSYSDKKQNKINKPKPPKYKSIKVNENDYEKLLLLIEENGIDIRL